MQDYAKFCSVGQILGCPFDNDQPDQSFLKIIEELTRIYRDLKNTAIEQAQKESVEGATN
jgi:hypothetical protein